MQRIGNDIVAIQRIEKAMENREFLRILTDAEKAIFHTYHGHRAVEWVAGRFAAKEAIYKAIHQFHPCVISEIEVLADEVGAPSCHIAGMDIQVSIAHEQDYATAFALVTIQEDTL